MHTGRTPYRYIPKVESRIEAKTMKIAVEKGQVATDHEQGGTFFNIQDDLTGLNRLLTLLFQNVPIN